MALEAPRGGGSPRGSNSLRKGHTARPAKNDSSSDRTRSALIGGGAILAAAMQGPLSATVLMLELTHSNGSLTVPLLLAIGEATILAGLLGAPTIYSARLPEAAPPTRQPDGHQMPDQLEPRAGRRRCVSQLTTRTRVRAHELLAYPLGFHTVLGSSGCVWAAVSHALATSSCSPAGRSIWARHSRHAQRP